MNVTELKAAALNHTQDIFSIVMDFRLEQFEKDSAGFWTVVISFFIHNTNVVVQKDPTTGKTENTNPPYERIFKTLILGEDGDLKKVLMYKEG